MEAARGLSKLLAYAVRNSLPNAPKSGETKDEGIRNLAREIGKSEAYIRNHLDLLTD